MYVSKWNFSETKQDKTINFLNIFNEIDFTLYFFLSIWFCFAKYFHVVAKFFYEDYSLSFSFNAQILKIIEKKLQKNLQPNF